MRRLFLALLPCFTAAALAQPTTTLTQLLEALPAPPAQAEAAARWLDPQGRLQHPGMLALQQAIDAHKQAMARLGSQNANTAQAQAGYATQDLMQGIGDAGIDVPRMQADPAYAAQVQERLSRMTPAEQMALAQRMAAPINRDRRVANPAQAMASDPPAAKAAYEAGQAYTQAQARTQRLTQKLALWKEADAAVQQLLARRLEPGLPRPAMAADNIGCEAACQAQWEAYAARMLPLMVARDTQVLQLRAAALQRHRAALAAELQAVDRHMAATRFGSQSHSGVHREQILAYDLTAVGEVEFLRDRLADAVRSASQVVNCGRQVVLFPGTVCQPAAKG